MRDVSNKKQQKTLDVKWREFVYARGK